MKKISIVLAVLFFIVIYYGCSDDTVTQQKNIVISTSVRIVPDTLEINVKAQDTTINFSSLDSNLQFANIPKIIYNINPTDGNGDIIFRDNSWTNIWSKHFTGYMNDSITLPQIPWMSYFTITNYTGTISIKVVRNN
ncbi:MAG: hypothetical protein WC358_03600 [Ignavibacteria bacterium]|jgi:hypothetical protein